MNKYIRALYSVPFGIIKMSIIKVFHWSSFRGPFICMMSPLSEITVDRGAKLSIGKYFKMRDGSKIRVRRGGVCTIGHNSFLSSNNIITCHDRIEIGDDVQFGPNVQIYDQDHDFRFEGGLKSGKFKTNPIIIGNNVWIGANSVVLRGSEIGNNSVVGAGCIVKGRIPDNSVFVQKSHNNITKIEKRMTNE